MSRRLKVGGPPSPVLGQLAWPPRNTPSPPDLKVTYTETMTHAGIGGLVASYPTQKIEG